MMDDEEMFEEPDTVRCNVDGHDYVVTYGRAPYQVHAATCEKCATP